MVAAQNTLAPGGFSGWHSHPGTVVLVVQSGEFTLFSERVKGGKCTVHTYSSGQVYLEQPGDEENAVNNGTVPAVLAVTFFNVPHGGSNRIERTDPGNCPPGLTVATPLFFHGLLDRGLGAFRGPSTMLIFPFLAASLIAPSA